MFNCHSRKYTLALTCIAPLFATTLHAEDHNYGPLRSYAQSPIQSISLAPVLRSAKALPIDYKEIYGSVTAASVWADTDDYTLDYYHNQVELGGKWVFSEKWLMDINYRWSFAADNHLDGLTESFHDLFGIDQNGREEVGRDQFTQNMTDYGLKNENFDGETLSNSVNIYLERKVYEKDKHSLSFGGGLFYNHVASGPFEGNSFDQNVQINYTYSNEAHEIYSMLGLTHHSRDKLNDLLPMKSMTFSTAVGYRYQLFDNHQILAEYHLYDGYIDDSSDLSEASHEALIGYRYLMENSAIEIFATENMVNMDNSTDISFTIGYRYQL
ncbi:DUF3187 family protein [Vibrio maerlii]|uniref:DUF3187 family protein n=1 Tax=Vibrio maerlii TaxID=2231648 RepID=UPI000E3E1C35|nr:DUF3187 family protein [Vibrio maerlii]